MVVGVLFLTLVVLALLLAAFIYQIVTTPLTAVDAPTLARSAAASSAADQVLPDGLATGPARGSAALEAPGRQSRIAGVLTIAGLAALVIGGWLFLHIAHGAALCSHQAIEICSQGFVLLTGSQLAGGAIALAGLVSIVIAAVLALR